MEPTEPPACHWAMPDPQLADENGLVGIGADLAPGTILAAYRAGLFPMPVGGQRHPGPTGWWSPDPRGVLPLDGLRVSRSLRRSCTRYEVRVDTAFAAVLDACAAPDRPGGWISAEIRAAYLELHRLGWAHSVEAWSLPSPGNTPQQLVGGLYGLAIGGLFAGESMFHTATDASKVALVALVDLLRGGADDQAGADEWGGAADRCDGPSVDAVAPSRDSACDARLLDVQWVTPHLATLGAVAIPRGAYLRRLSRAVTLPLPAAFAAGAAP